MRNPMLVWVMCMSSMSLSITFWLQSRAYDNWDGQRLCLSLALAHFIIRERAGAATAAALKLCN